MIEIKVGFGKIMYTDVNLAEMILERHGWKAVNTYSADWEHPFHSFVLTRYQILNNPKGTIESLLHLNWDKEVEKIKRELELKYSYSTVSCQHEWTTYIGLNEKYQYCKKCDLKHD